MWGATEVPDQAEEYANSLLLRAKLSEKEKFNLLRATSVTVGVAGTEFDGFTFLHPQQGERVFFTIRDRIDSRFTIRRWRILIDNYDPHCYGSGLCHS